MLDAESLGASFNSTLTDITAMDNVGIILTWTGTSPVGTIEVQVSNDTAATPTTWTALDFGSSISISGNSGTHTININQNPFAKLRLAYTRTSGTGEVTAKLVMKQVG